MKAAKDKIKSLAEIVRIAKNAKRRGLTIVTTNGAFDLLHVGHARSLEKAKSLGDLLIVGINSDSSVRTHKDKSRPIVAARERAEIVASLAAVDYVFIFNTPNPIPWLRELKPDIHVKGKDRKMGEIIEKEAVEEKDGKIVLLPHDRRHSTTALIEKIKGLSRPRIRSRNTP